MKNRKVVRAVKASNFKDFTKKLMTIQNVWKGEVISISKQESEEYEIVFQTRKPKNIPCRIPATDKYGWRIPEKFYKQDWKNEQDAITAIKYNVMGHYDNEDARNKHWKEISEDQIIHILWYMKKWGSPKEPIRQIAHSALIFAKDIK